MKPQTYQKYLKFVWDVDLYKFLALPYGLSPGPRWFTKLMKPVMAHLREHKFTSSIFIDDIFLLGDTIEEINLNIISTIELLLSLKLYPHHEKCNLVASHEINILGFCINSLTMTVSLTNEKQESLVTALIHFIKKDHVKIRALATIIGRLVAAFPGSEFGPLFYRHLESNKQRGLRWFRGNFEGTIDLDDLSKVELQWWVDNLPSMHKSLSYPNPSIQIYTDASNTGWGAYFEGQNTSGTWSHSESLLHINVKEMIAVLFGLKSLIPDDICNITLKLNIDNTTVVHILKNMGSYHNEDLNSYNKQIWLWAKSKSIWLLPVYVSTTKNLADVPSRKVFIDAEWQLNPDVFTKLIQDLNFVPTIDLFASRVNTQLSSYISYKPDPDALDTDAFSIDWHGLKFYAFPPFSCISRCLQKVKVDKAEGIIVVPRWPTQPYYPVLLKMSKMTLTIPKNPLNLVMPNQPHLVSDIAKKATFLASLISANT